MDIEDVVITMIVISLLSGVLAFLAGAWGAGLAVAVIGCSIAGIVARLVKS
jgi:hypothetical protein